jgi:hypothetical protein
MQFQLPHMHHASRVNDLTGTVHVNHTVFTIIYTACKIKKFEFAIHEFK